MDRLPKHLYFSDGAENDVETLFILESPYKEELYWEFPCMGTTGKTMSKALIQNADIALGDLILHNNSQTKRYALFETFKFPLDKSLRHGLDADELFWQDIKKKRSRVLIRNFFSQNKLFFSYSYKCNLECAIKIFSRKLKEIVVCGDIAQEIFMQVFGIAYPDRDNRVIEIVGKRIDLYFVEHPAFAARKKQIWTYKRI